MVLIPLAKTLTEVMNVNAFGDSRPILMDPSVAKILMNVKWETPAKKSLEIRKVSKMPSQNKIFIL